MKRSEEERLTDDTHDTHDLRVQNTARLEHLPALILSLSISVIGPENTACSVD